jgi:biopolymer transport protein ExbB
MRLVSIWPVLILAMQLCLADSSAFADSKRGSVDRQKDETAQTMEDVRGATTSSGEERERLLSELILLKEQVSARETELQTLKDGLGQKLQTLNESRVQPADEEEMRALEAVIRNAANEVQKMVRGSVVTPQFPSRAEIPASLIDPDRFTTFENLKALVELLFEEMAASGEVVRDTREVTGPDGRKVSGEIVRVGKFAALFRSGQDVGYLRCDEEGRGFEALAWDLPRSIERALNLFMDGASDLLPLDLSGGVALEHLTRRGDLREYLRSGGILVWPILGIGALAVVLALERLVHLGRIKGVSGELMERLQAKAGQGEWEECRRLCSTHSKAPTCRVLETALENRGASREILENALQEAILKELPRLERFLSTLSVFAAIAPLLGLLGTVNGMITTFQVITAVGTGDPRMMSSGISEALITTQLGLMVAIPIIVLHNFIERRVDRIVGEMEEKGVALSVILMKNGTTSGEPAYHAL